MTPSPGQPLLAALSFLEDRREMARVSTSTASRLALYYQGMGQEGAT